MRRKKVFLLVIVSFINPRHCISGKNLKEGLVTLEEDLLKLTDELQQEAQCIPNMTHPDVPIGDEDCSTIRTTVSILIRILDFCKKHC